MSNLDEVRSLQKQLVSDQPLYPADCFLWEGDDSPESHAFIEKLLEMDSVAVVDVGRPNTYYKLQSADQYNGGTYLIWVD